MSAAYKCDKCSEYKDGAPFVVVTFTLVREDKPWAEPRGVCQECARDMCTSKEKAEEIAKQAAERERQRLLDEKTTRDASKEQRK